MIQEMKDLIREDRKHLNGCRGCAKKYNCKYKSKEYYKEYSKLFVEEKKKRRTNPGYPKTQVSRQVFNAVLRDYFKEASRRILEGQRIKFPIIGSFYVGRLKVSYQKIIENKSQLINWGTFNKTNVKNKFLNEHTEGYVYRFIWIKNYNQSNLKWFKFIPCRGNKRRLAKVLKTSNINNNIAVAYRELF